MTPSSCEAPGEGLLNKVGISIKSHVCVESSSVYNPRIETARKLPERVLISYNFLVDECNKDTVYSKTSVYLTGARLR